MKRLFLVLIAFCFILSGYGLDASKRPDAMICKGFGTVSHAAFTWSFANNGQSVDLMVTPSVDDLGYNHQCLLEKRVAGQWITVVTHYQYNTPDGYFFPNLETASTYRITHLLIPENDPHPGNPEPENYSASVEIFTGG